MNTLLDEIESQLRHLPDADARADAARILDAARAGGENGSAERARSMGAARASGIPLAYVIGRTSFMGLEILAAPGALVARQETELLGQTALELLEAMQSAVVIDMCCGSGNLACALARHAPGARIWASDLTDGCVKVARSNVEHLGLGDRVTVAQGDLFAGLADAGLQGKVDLIVCNPPYISEKRLGTDRSHLVEHEPREAFDGGPYGLTIHQRVVKEALPFLKVGGWLLFEIGLGQHRQVTILFDRTRAYEDVRLANSEAGEPRVALGRKKAPSDNGTGNP